MQDEYKSSHPHQVKKLIMGTFYAGKYLVCYHERVKAIFLDRDGTVNIGVPKYERVDSVDKVELLPNTLKALEILASLEYVVFFVTNQAGLAEGLISEAEFTTINDKILDLISPSGIDIKKTYVCPHNGITDCECRKPKTKLLMQAAQEYDLDLGQSWMIGDRQSDVMTGINAGTKSILVKTGVPTIESPEATISVPSLLEAAQYIASIES